MKRTEAYLRLAEVCEREAGVAQDAGERRQLDVLSRALRSWAADPPVDELDTPTQECAQRTPRP